MRCRQLEYIEKKLFQVVIKSVISGAHFNSQEANNQDHCVLHLRFHILLSLQFMDREKWQ